jgi:hypothetical protein
MTNSDAASITLMIARELKKALSGTISLSGLSLAPARPACLQLLQ